MALGILLNQGIGDTFRISLTRDPVEEVRVGFELLRALKIRERGPELISCPTCGRTQIDLFRLAEEVEGFIQTMEAPLKIAVMGCVVNGPGRGKAGRYRGGRRQWGWYNFQERQNLEEG